MLNMIKSKSLYNDGMKVLIYSSKRNEASEKTKGVSEQEVKEMQGWHRGGEDLGYYQNKYRKEQAQNNGPSFQQRYFYTFTFSHQFEYDDDVVYFAYSMPYTYSDLTDYLCEI